MRGSLWRRVCALPVVTQLREQARTARCAAFAEPIPKRSQATLARLRCDGIAVLRAPVFAALLTRTERAAFRELLETAAEGLDSRDVLDADEIFRACPRAYEFGIAESLIDIAEAYLGEPCLYLGVALKRERADGRLVGARGWHRDIEDDRMLRLLVYLNDVGVGGGPFEFVPLGREEPLPAAAGYVGGYLDDRRANVLAPPEHREEVLGTAGQAIFFDGVRIFHRAQPPRIQPRYSLTFSYVTRRPKELRLSARLSRPTHAEFTRRLSPRLAACVPRPRSL